jgi:hypothetical protein
MPFCLQAFFQLFITFIYWGAFACKHWDYFRFCVLRYGNPSAILARRTRWYSALPALTVSRSTAARLCSSDLVIMRAS